MDVKQCPESPQESDDDKRIADAKSQEGNLAGKVDPKQLFPQRVEAKGPSAAAAAKAHAGKERKPRADKGKRRGRYKPRRPKPLGKENTNAFLASVYSILCKADLSEEGEKFIEGHVMFGCADELIGKPIAEWTPSAMLGIAEALKGGDQAKWEAAIEKERLRILIFETWQPATDAELASAKNIIPLALLLSVKRDCTYRCSAVALGHLDKGKGEV